MNKSFWNNSDKNILILFAIFAITVLSGLTPWIYSDGVGEFAWVRSIVIEGSLDCANEFEYYTSLFQEKYGWEGTGADLYPVKTITGYQANKYPVGTALLWIPFFLAAHVFTFFLNILGFDFPLNGYSKFYTLFISFGSAFYAFAGLLLSYFVTKKLFNKNIAFLSVITLWFASSLPVYMYLYPSMPHSTALFMISLFIFTWLKIREKESIQPKHFAILGIIGGVAMLVRYENAMFFTIPAFDILFQVIQSYRNKNFKAVKTNLTCLIVLTIFSFFAFLPQIIVWKVVFGKFLLEPYEEMGMLIHQSKGLEGPHFPGVNFSLSEKSFVLSPIFHFFSHPYLGESFFASSHGLYFWTPIYIFATIGIILFMIKNKRIGILLFIGLAFFIYFVSCAKQNGMTFGNRYLLAPIIIFIIGLAALMNVVHKKFSLKLLYLIVAFFITWNGLLIVQYSTGLINRQGSVSWKMMVINQFTKAPSYWIKNIVPFLFNRNEVYKGNKQN